MKRTIYNIACREGIKQVTGYTFSTGELRFGVSNQSPKTGQNIPDWWAVTELTTGYSVTNNSTRKAAIEAILKKDKLDIISNYLKDNKPKDINPDVEIQTTYWGSW